ncbi:MAG: sigma-70 family RNA polymerase sigma factor [Chlorobi bacterium]|nr:sigma-70 family RNA polymerase sigma factor [Chlorobiota bacterium]
MNDIELIDAIKNGDKNAFRLLIEKYQDNLFKVSIGLLHNTQDAEEIVQDVFFQVYKSIYSFRQEAKLSTWLYRITVNKSLNLIRKQKRNKIVKNLSSFLLINDNKEIEFEEQDYAHPLKILELKETAKEVFAAINSLPTNQKIAFTLNKYDNISYKEISEIMELSLSSVESLIHRAKVNLQKKLIHFKNIDV